MSSRRRRLCRGHKNISEIFATSRRRSPPATDVSGDRDILSLDDRGPERLDICNAAVAKSKCALELTILQACYLAYIFWCLRPSIKDCGVKTSKYLHTLQQRYKWKDLAESPQVGDLILIKQDSVLPLQWQRGRILKLYPGRDDVVRVVDMRKPTSVLHRTVTSLALIPIRQKTADICGPGDIRETSNRLDCRRIVVPLDDFGLCTWTLEVQFWQNPREPAN
ncbi:hypothetical protein EVAR_33160_1 [Eumeta japonica]|uniref:DUF5641 domain-containing protein n=1 Tax=Eumeta variegata TaxID=151549 RepID=A0A4C1ZVR9_EUMVA|nr:hypothetical protein EVAR_33160_1 [Eumeta japonica]